MKYAFGKTQVYASKKMEKHPVLAKIMFSIFGYTKVGNYARSRVFLKAIEDLPLHDFDQILDLGAGLGEFTFMLAEKYNQKNFTALEILDNRIGSLKKVKEKIGFPNVSIFEQKIENYPHDDYFDFIFSIDVFEHIPEDQMPFDACFKKLKKGGYLMVKIPNVTQRTILPNKVFHKHNEWLKKEHVGQVLDLNQLSDKFREAGFVIEKAFYSDGLFSRIGWEIDYVASKLGIIGKLIAMPIAKCFILIDNLFDYYQSGNAIQVVGRKI